MKQLRHEEADKVLREPTSSWKPTRLKPERLTSGHLLLKGDFGVCAFPELLSTISVTLLGLPGSLRGSESQWFCLGERWRNPVVSAQLGGSRQSYLSLTKPRTSTAVPKDWLAFLRSKCTLKCYPLQYSCASLVAQLVKNQPAMWETWVQSLGWETTLEKGKATTPVF